MCAFVSDSLVCVCVCPRVRACVYSDCVFVWVCIVTKSEGVTCDMCACVCVGSCACACVSACACACACACAFACFFSCACTRASR